jgi:hypothetical protein
MRWPLLLEEAGASFFTRRVPGAPVPAKNAVRVIDTTAADVESTFKRAWALLASNPIVVVPPIVVGIAAGVVVAFGLIFGGVGALLAGTAADNSAAQGAGIAAIAVVVAIVLAFILVLSVAQAAFTAGMAGAAWQTGKATLADGWNAFRARGLQMFLAMLLLALVGCAAVVLAPVTLLLSLVAYVIFTLYVSASVIVGGRTAGDAIAESFRLAKRNFWPTTDVAARLVLRLDGRAHGHDALYRNGAQPAVRRASRAPGRVVRALALGLRLGR